MKRIILITAAVCAAALLLGGAMYFVSSGAYRDFDWRLVLI